MNKTGMTRTRAAKAKAGRKRKCSKAAKWIKRGLVAAVVCGLAVTGKLGWGQLKRSNNFKIARIDVVGAERAGKDEILYLSKLKPGMGIFEFRLGSAVKAVEAHPWVKKAQVSRELPDQVVIRVWEQRPVAIIIAGEPFYMNSDLRLFKKLIPGDDLNYPIITGISLDDIEQRDPQTLEIIRNVLATWELAKNSKIYPGERVSEVHVEPSVGLSLVTASGPVVGFGDTGFEEKFRKLERIKVELGEQFYSLKGLDLSQPERVVARFFKKEMEPVVEAGMTAQTKKEAQ